jgi:anti-sigma B factor antagonist
VSGDLTISTTPDADKGVTIALGGELDGYTAPGLRAEIEHAFDDGAQSLVLDIAALTFVDSSGISVLVWAHKQLVERGGALALRAPQPDVFRVLEITRLNQVFQID